MEFVAKIDNIEMLKLEDTKLGRFAKLEDCGSMHFGVREICMCIFQLSGCHHMSVSHYMEKPMRCKLCPGLFY